MSSSEQTRPQFSERQIKLAARILYLGLNPKHGEFDEYQELHRNMVQNPQIQTVLKLMTEEFDLNILDISPQMITMVPQQRSLFATRAKDYDFVTSTSDKPIFGLILIAIAALLFPKPWMLQSDEYEGKKFQWREVDEFIRQKIDDVLEEKEKFEQSEVQSEDGIQAILFEYQKIRADVGSTRDRSSTRYFIGKVMDYLETQGFIVNVSEDLYHPTKKFKIHTRQLFQDPNFRELINLGDDD